jgi:hypothetical protein
MANQLLKLFRTFRALRFKEQKTLIVNTIKHHLIASFTCLGVFIIAGGCVLFPPTGRIVIIGPEMRNGLELLENTSTGKELIKKARQYERVTYFPDPWKYN